MFTTILGLPAAQEYYKEYKVIAIRGTLQSLNPYSNRRKWRDRFVRIPSSNEYSAMYTDLDKSWIPSSTQR